MAHDHLFEKKTTSETVMGQTERLAQPQAFGRYQLIARLAHGRMGDVYKGKNQGVEGFERILVVKTINPALASIERFVDIVVEEAQRAVALSHANVAQVLDLGREDDSQTVYIATEFVNGLDLRRALNIAQHTQTQWSAELSLFIASEIANGLDYAHRRKDFNFNKLNLIHRNLTPHNIMLSTEGDVKITDFGIARAMDIIPPTDEEEQMRRAIYSAPEVARGEAAYQQSDIFSLGLILIEMLEGRHPYADPNPQVMIQKAQQGLLPPISTFRNIPPTLVSLIEGMCQADPFTRVASAGQVYEELIGFIYGNNLKSDARTLAIHIQELRKEEPEAFPDLIEMSETGMEEVSLSDLQVPEAVQSFYDDDELSEATRDALPRQRIQELLRGTDAPEAQQSPLPGALEEHFRASRAGQGKGVLIWGQLGAGRDYLPDRLGDILNLRGNTQTIAIQISRDDKHRPFGAMSKALFEALMPYCPEDAAPNTFALNYLQQIGCQPQTIELFAALWSQENFPSMGYRRMHETLGRACQRIIAKLCERATVVFVLDRIEFLDTLSMDVLRQLLTQLGRMPVMVIMSTLRMEEMRNKLDTSNTHLHTVKVVGSQTPKLANTKDLSANATEILTLLAVSEVTLSQADLSRILGLTSNVVIDSVRELIEFGIVRAPETGIFLCAIPELAFWVEQRFGRQEIQRHALNLVRYADHNSHLVPQLQNIPTQVRLLAQAGERQRLVHTADAYRNFLLNAGFFRTALTFQKRFAETLTGRTLGIPQANVTATLQHAELALQLARVELTQSSLSPLPALCDRTHDEAGRVRTDLLFSALQMRQDDLEEAYLSLKRAAATAETLQHPGLIVRAFAATATYYERFGDTFSAQRMIERALHILEHTSTEHLQPGELANVYALAVSIFCSRGMPLLAQQHHRSLQQLAEATGRADILCRTDFAQATIRIANGEYEAAKSLMLRAEQQAYEYDLTALGVEIARQHVSFSIHAQDFRLAQSKLDQLLQIAQATQDVYSYQRARDMQAYCAAINNQDTRKAIEHLQQSLQRAIQRDIPKDIYRCHNFLEQISRRYQRHQDAQMHEQAKRQMAQRMRYRAM